MRFLVIVLFCFFQPSVPLCTSAATHTNTAPSGLTEAEFRIFAQALHSLPGRIEAIQIFPATDSGNHLVAVATLGQQTGWQLLVLKISGDSPARIVWKSGVLSDSFAVADGSAMNIYSPGREDDLSFVGCAQHSCPDVFSVLLYVPSKRQAYTVSYVLGKISYSPNLTGTDAEAIKADLNDLLDSHLKELGRRR
jgi:hypothetical protein